MTKAQEAQPLSRSLGRAEGEEATEEGKEKTYYYSSRTAESGSNTCRNQVTGNQVTSVTVKGMRSAGDVVKGIRPAGDVIVNGVRSPGDAVNSIRLAGGTVTVTRPAG